MGLSYGIGPDIGFSHLVDRSFKFLQALSVPGLKPKGGLSFGSAVSN